MGILVKQEHERSKLQERIAAELREKNMKTSLVDTDAPDMVADSEYIKDTRETSGAAWAWFILLGVIIFAVVVSAVRGAWLW